MAPEAHEADEAEAALRPPPPGWEPISTAPDNGRPIWLTDGEGRYAEGFWRNSRRRAASNGLWEPYHYWAQCNAGGMRVPFEPTAWRPANVLG